MDVVQRHQGHGVPWNWPLVLSVLVLNISIPNLVLSYGIILLHAQNHALPVELGIYTPTTFLVVFCLTQCWCRDAADTWGGDYGHRVLSAMGLILIVTGFFLSAFIPIHLHPFVCGGFGGLGSSIISAQVEAVIFDNYDTHLGIIRALCYAGQALGQTLFSHIIMAFINYYGFTMSFIAISAIVMQALPAVMYLKIEYSVRRPYSSRFVDLGHNYLDDSCSNYYTNELQLDDLNRKNWRNPSDDNLVSENSDEHANTTAITPPPSPEERRRNIFGVEILPEIPEEEEEVESESGIDDIKNKNRLSKAIKRLSVLLDNFDEYINKQSRRDSRIEGLSNTGYSELEVTYDKISPQTDVCTEELYNSLSFRCQSAYENIKRKVRLPSYKIYRFKKRILNMLHVLHDTFIKPMLRSLSCWQFYPALLLSFTRLSYTILFLSLLPIIASRSKPAISLGETNFLISLHGFTWICFLLATPWLVQTKKRNYKYITVCGLMMSTAACFVMANGYNHDLVAIGSVISGLGFGAITSCWETTVQDLIGARRWSKLHSSLESITGVLLGCFIIGVTYILRMSNGLYLTMYVLGGVVGFTMLTWTIIVISYFYFVQCRNTEFRFC